MAETRKDFKPQALDDKPTLPEHLGWYMNSFNILSSRRTSGMAGANPISFSEIVAYLAVFPWFDNELFVKYVIALDNTFLKHHYEKHEHTRKHTDRSKQPRR